MASSEAPAPANRAIRGDPALTRRLASLIEDGAWLGRCAVLKRDRRCVVRAGDAPGVGRVVVKTWTLTRPRDALSRLAGSTQALRHWRGAATLASLGVPTAEPLAVFRRGRAETLVMREIPGKSLLRHLDEIARDVSTLDARGRAELARAVGDGVRALADRGWFNRDHKPSNIIVTEREGPMAPGEARFAIGVIDAVGIRRDRLRCGGLRMLTSLMLEPLGVDCPPSRALRMRALLGASDGASLKARKSAWRAVSQAVDEHGDPTPKINPLLTTEA